jgi:hypothetical protein
MTAEIPVRGNARKRRTRSVTWFLTTVGLSLLAAWALLDVVTP